MSEGSFTPKLTATSRAEGGSYKRKKHNMKRRSGYPMTMRSQDPEGRKRGPREKTKVVKNKVLRKVKL